MPAKQITKKKTAHKQKQHGTHHRHTKQYLKAYWPYVPMLIIVALGLFIGTPRSTSSQGVLAYATEMSSQRLLDSTNEQRISQGRKSLALNSTLSTAAQAKAADMAQRNYWSHTTPEGKEPWHFVSSAGYNYSKAGENLAYGFSSSSETVRGWMNSASHRANLLDSNFTEVGFGYINASDYNQSGDETIVVAMYASPGVNGQTHSAVAGNNSMNTHTPGAEPASTSISMVQSLTAGKMPWVAFFIGLATGGMLLFMVTKHGLAFKRALVHGEEFILHHPMLDIALVSLVMLGYVLSQTSGFIR